MECNQLVSVIIPTYNRAGTIEKSIRSVLKQTYSNIEIVVVDDGSTDNTEEIVCAIEDSRIRYIKAKENRGASAARNLGVREAKADIIAFHDSDDSWHDDKLEKQIRYLLLHPDYKMVYCAYCLQRYNGEFVKVPYLGTYGNLEGDILGTLLVNNTIGTPTMVMYKKCFEELHGFDETMECLEDWEFAIRFSRSYLIGYIDEILMDAFLLQGGISSNVANFCLNRCKMITKYKTELLQRELFDRVVMDLFKRAEGWGALELVKKLLLTQL